MPEEVFDLFKLDLRFFGECVAEKCFKERDDVFWRRYAGGGLAATKLLLEKTRPGIDPLSAENLLIPDDDRALSFYAIKS